MAESNASSPLLRLDRPQDGIARLTLHRPPVNALSRRMVCELEAQATALANQASLRVLILAADGPVFCAGADLKERQKMDEAEVVAAVQGISRMTSAIAALPMPTIAAVSGPALGGGLELALACDLRVAADSATLGLPECSLAIIPGAGGTQRLARIAGRAVAKRWVFTAEAFDAAPAARDGVVDLVVPAGDLEQETLRLAGRIARCGPLALRAAKRAIDGGLDAGGLEAGLAVEAAEYARIIPSEDRREALRAFSERRTPRYGD